MGAGRVVPAVQLPLAAGVRGVDEVIGLVARPAWQGNSAGAEAPAPRRLAHWSSPVAYGDRVRGTFTTSTREPSFGLRLKRVSVPACWLLTLKDTSKSYRAYCGLVPLTAWNGPLAMTWPAPFLSSKLPAAS